jgi:hypothetical protein
MKTRHVAAVLLLAPLLALTACTPGATGTLGLLRQEDGSLEVLVRLCHGSVNLLNLRAINSFPPDSELGSQPEDNGWRNVKAREYPMPAPIVGDAELAMPFRERTLGSDALFLLTAYGDDGENAVSGQFGASELADVQPGEVFTPIGMFASDIWDSSDDPIVSRQEFERFADDFCS